MRSWRSLAALLVALGMPASARAQAPSQSWLDTTRTFEQRARDLVAQMTLAEKVAQMQDDAPAIPRLGLPAYNWWNEGLHGVARSGLATVFPQAIGFAATWDDSLVFRMATVISDEARAKHHEYLRHDQHGRYQGLTIWSPNINLFRDPRWGRGQETYGEDPWLTGRLAVQFIRGLQGDDPRYFKAVATVKHFAVHSGPEPGRHTFDATVSPRDLRESYLPHFEAGIREGGAYSLMCAYNRVGGAAACASDTLLAGILRHEWRFPGFVVSDCGAIDDIWMRHRVLPDAATAAAQSVKAGTDLECGNNSYPHLVEAVQRGLLPESAIDTALTRLVLGRMRLGMFDPPSRVRWQRIPYSVVDQPAHRAHARQVARESMVLLKNAGSMLPLRKDLGTLAVIGPNADQWRVMLGNYNGEPSDAVTPLRGIREAVSRRTRVLYARGSDLADGVTGLDTAAATASPASGGAALEEQALRIARQADAVVMVLGLSPRLEGEEMPVQIPGFSGGDRTTMDLPAPQQRLLEQVVALGKPTVLVLLNGSALAVSWAQANVPAILEAWYPGQAGGSAIADVLFGDYNPAGRLPVTFYRDTSDLPPFTDYRMLGDSSRSAAKGRTYRFFGGTPLYPFGHGLSYTTFRYDDLRTSAIAVTDADTITASVQVTNSGRRAGDEVVQLYVRYPGSTVPRPLRELRGYQRVTLRPGERRTVTFRILASTLRYWDEAAHRWRLDGTPVELMVGASSMDIRLRTTVQTRRTP